MEITRFKNLYQVVIAGVGSVFQSHMRSECEEYIRDHRNQICTLGIKCCEVSKPIRYANTIKVR